MINPIPNDERKLLEPLVGKTMLELGNKRNQHGTYKNYFESIGIDHTSVDLNGLDGALPLDLTQPLSLGVFDIVTNIGTTEHVMDQSMVWRNIHEAVSLGGILVSVTPKPGDWKWHGFFYPTHLFYKDFAALNGYVLDRLYEDRIAPRTNIYCRMTKNTVTPFSMPDESLIYENNP